MLPEGREGTRAARVVPPAAAEVQAQNGVVVTRGFDPAVLGTEVFLGHAVADAGTRIPRHVHSVDTIAYLVSGRAVFRSGDDLEDVHEMGPGDWLFVPAGMVHVEETPDDAHAEFVYARDGRGGETTYLEPW